MSDKRHEALLVGGLMLAFGTWLLLNTPAYAVYCTGAGQPAGCVARPAPGAGAGTPGAGVRPGVGAGEAGVGAERGAGAGAPGVGTEPANRGGPVNRRGVR